jgi:hypothetical protein
MPCYEFPIKGLACCAKDSPLKAHLALCGLGISQIMSQSMMSFPTQSSKTRYL